MHPYPQHGSDSALLIKHLLDRPLAWTPEQKIIYRDLHEFTYVEFRDRVGRLASLLQRMGVTTGDRVGVMDWDSHRYLEFFFAVPMIGAVLHTINVRLSPEQILFTIHHAEDKVLFFHPDFLALAEAAAAKCPSVKHRVAMPDSGPGPATALPLDGEYEHLLSMASPLKDFPELPEDTVATLFYTTGSTGDPKGVFFTHRQLVLHTITSGFGLAAFPDPASINCRDVYMPLTPMFHVHAWGVPYIATLLGIRQVYPGRYEPGTLLRLLVQHQVTLSHCVPTLLKMILTAPEAAHVDFSRWKIITGGAKLPNTLARLAMDRGIRIAQGYGMSETCPIIAVSQFKPAVADGTPEEQLDILDRTGFPLPLVRACAFDSEGRALPPGAEHAGELVLRAPWLAPGYFKDPERSRALWEGGWLHTGDLAYVDTDGYIRITDRLKDVIKTGGEWISSLELENILARHEAVEEVAVVGTPDPKWDERPLALVRLRETHRGQVSERHLRHYLQTVADTGAIHKRAVLTRIEFIEQLPHTSVGKIDKKALRARAQSV
jgi:fatty-acyl-CoA synthase